MTESRKLLEIELSELRNTAESKINGWRLVMLFQMPTFCGVYIYSQSWTTLLVLSVLVIFTVYLTLFEKLYSDRVIMRYRKKIIHGLPSDEMDNFIEQSYDERFFLMLSPLSRFLSHITYIWPGIVTIVCLYLLYSTR